MAGSAALLMSPPRQNAGDENKAARTTASASTQGPEDGRLAEQVERALRATGYGPLRSIEVAVHARLVILAGRVPSYYMKQVAQTIALAVPGAGEVRNEVEVGRPS